MTPKFLIVCTCSHGMTALPCEDEETLLEKLRKAKVQGVPHKVLIFDDEYNSYGEIQTQIPTV